MERNYNCIKKIIKNDEKTFDILTNLSSLKTREIKRILKSAALICAFYIFALSIYSFLFDMSFTWIFMLLSIGFAAIGLGLEKAKKIDEGYLKIYQTYINKTDAEYSKDTICVL